MTARRKLATMAVREAARVRRRLGIGPTSSACPFDIAAALGVIVHLQELPSLEGMYSPGRRATVVLGTERPWGRMRHTCGHELAHHVFGHGIRLDELCHDGRRGWIAEEYLADRFSTALLMPKLAVVDAVRRRGWDGTTLSALQTFVLAQDFGVGYRNFVSHAERTLGLIPSASAASLRRQGRSLPQLREAAAGFQAEYDVFVADEHWGARALDMQTGDVVVTPDDALFTGVCARRSCSPVSHLVAITAGKGELRLRTRESPINIRVSQRGFTGLAAYRHLEDGDG